MIEIAHMACMTLSRHQAALVDLPTCVQVLEVSGTSLQDPAPWANGASFGEALLEPTIIYVKRVLALHEAVTLKGVVHITGGGMTENIPRVIPKHLGVHIRKDAWEVPPLFRWLQEQGRIEDAEMRRTFNMGVGNVLVVAPGDVDKARAVDPELFVLGEVVANSSGVTYV